LRLACRPAYCQPEARSLIQRVASDGAERWAYRLIQNRSSDNQPPPNSLRGLRQ
jgi:hypothetical protein